MVRWHHKLSGLEFEQTLGDDAGQGSLACRSSCGRKELDTTQWLNSSTRCGEKGLVMNKTPISPNGSPVIQGTEDKRANTKTKDVLTPRVIQEIPRVLGPVSQELQAKIYVFLTNHSITIA